MRLCDRPIGKIVFDPVQVHPRFISCRTQKGVLKSTDNGQTWIPRINGLHFKSVVELAINPLRTSTLYLGGPVRRVMKMPYVTKINPAGSSLDLLNLPRRSPVRTIHSIPTIKLSQ